MKARCTSISTDRRSAVLLTLFIALGGCAPGRAPSTEADGGAKPRRIVDRAVQAHGGLERWNRFQRLTVRYGERWSWPFTWFRTTPWPTNNIRGTLTLWLHEARAEIVFDDRPDWRWRWIAGKIQGFGAGPQPMLHWKPEFVLPRTHYLTLLPFKFLDGGARLRYSGRSGDRDEIMVDFDPATGATPGDRYWAVFDSDSGRMSRVVLTVTAYGRLAVGALAYEEYRDVRGLLFPSRIRAMLHGPGWPLHLGEYSDWRLE